MGVDKEIYKDTEGSVKRAKRKISDRLKANRKNQYSFKQIF